MRFWLLLVVFLSFGTARAEDVQPPDQGVNVSESEGVIWADVACAPKGMLHVAFLHSQNKLSTKVLTVRTSADGGVSWSDPVHPSTADRQRTPQSFRILVDGGGRTYLIWKALKSKTDEDILGSYDAGALVYRVLEDGEWGKLVTVAAPGVGSSKGVWSWCASVDAKGQVHLLWTEQVPEQLTYPLKELNQGLILRATIAGGKAGAPSIVQRGRETEGAYGTKWLEGYHGIRGYVDEGGNVHWVSLRCPEGAQPNHTEIVYGDGTRELSLFTYEGTPSSFNFHPVELGRDAKGVDHVVFLDEWGPTTAVTGIAIAPGKDPGDPTPILEPAQLDGKIVGCQLRQGPGGRLALQAQIYESGNLPTDQFVCLNLTGEWEPAECLTQNATLKQWITGDGNYDPPALLVTHSGVHASGVFDGAGTFYSVCVDKTRTYHPDRMDPVIAEYRDAFLRKLKVP